MTLVITHAFFQQKCTKMNEVVTSLLPEINRDFEKLNDWRKSFDEEGEKIFEIREVSNIF